MDGDPVLDALRRAVERAPDDVALRTHLAEQLLAAGLAAEAIGHAARLLAEDPADASRQALMRAAIAGANDPA
ncbi:MAG TPA: tetratricopeptide repeat protein, partial [Candidatus Nanopelagicales bacterium]